MIEMDIHKSLHSAQGVMELHVQLRQEPGTFATLYGPSGAGKTSTLRILAGLMAPDRGSLVVDGETWFDAGKNINLKPQERKIGVVFQDYALFPNMSVQSNLEFAMDKKQDRGFLNKLMEITELQGLAKRKPGELSGGQQQRVALARALVQQPRLLLLDEPLAALDSLNRRKLQDYLGELHKQLGFTALMVSHDIGEILKLSGRVFVLENGRIQKEGSPEAIFISKNLSGKFQFSGVVLSIEQQEVVYVVSVQIQNQLVKVITGEAEIEGIQVGDKVVVASKAFNPILYKID